MKFIRDNPGLTFTAVLIFALIGSMVLFLVSNSPGSPAGVRARRDSETPTLRVETLSPSATPSPAASLTPSVTPTTAPSATPTATPLVCTGADREAIRKALEEVQVFKGLHYETNGAFPPGMYLLGVLTSGETRTDVLDDGTELDLARIFYLTGKGEMNWLWVVTGVVWTDGRYEPMNPWRWWTDCHEDPASCGIWPTREEAVKLFSTPGQLANIVISEWFVRPDAIHWENCGKPGQNIDKPTCALGLRLELESHGGSATFFQTGITPPDWVAFWWMITFQNQTFTLPESAQVCR